MPREHEITFRVRYSECDAMGVAHHGNYPAWFEMGRTELLRSRNIAYRDLEARGVFIVVVKLEINFKKPARYDDLLTLTTRLNIAGPVKIEHEYELRRDGSLLATAKTVVACVDRDGRAQRVPDVIAADSER